MELDSKLLDTKLYNLPSPEMDSGGLIGEAASKAGYASGRSWANDWNAWDMTVREALEALKALENGK